MLWLFLLTTIIFVILLLPRRDKRMVALYNQFPCDVPQWPIIGHVTKFIGDAEFTMKSIQMMGREAMSKGGFMATWNVNVLTCVLTDPVTIEYVLKHCLEKHDIVKLFRIIFGMGSAFAPVAIWRPRRKLHSPAFHPKNLSSFVDIFSKQSLLLVNKLKLVADKKPIAVGDYLAHNALDSICETVMGIKLNAQEKPNNPFYSAMKKLFHLNIERMRRPWLYNDLVASILNPVVMKYKNIIYKLPKKIIHEKRTTAKAQFSDNASTKINSSFLEMMMAKEKDITDLVLQEETLILIIGATDTSTVATAFTMVMLSRYPDVQERVYQELHEVFGNSDRPVTAEDLPRLRYLEAVIKESTRLYPPAPIIARKVDSDITLRITLIKGCGIFINIWATHRNPEYWGPDAEEFRPERFIEGPLKHPAAFLTFSHGPRGCIGSQYAVMSMKTTLAHILRNFRILPAPNPVTGRIPAHDEPFRLKYEIMMKDVDGFRVCLENRF